MLYKGLLFKKSKHKNSPLRGLYLYLPLLEKEVTKRPLKRPHITLLPLEEAINISPLRGLIVLAYPSARKQ